MRASFDPRGVAKFRADYAEWRTHRDAVIAMEETTGSAPACDWHDSDDRAVELLEAAAVLLASGR
jgi:hypothetical protein